MIEQHSHSEESDVDYEKEVLQLGRIWNEIKKNTPEPGGSPAPVPIPKENDKKNAQSRQNSAKTGEPVDKPRAQATEGGHSRCCGQQTCPASKISECNGQLTIRPSKTSCR